VSYVTDVEPIFKAHCVQCHGPDGASGGLRLDTASGTVKGGKSGALYIAGKSSDSLLMKRLQGVGGPRMPMGFNPLTDAQMQTISRWIDEGASLGGGSGKHWAYIVPMKTPVPTVAGSGTNPIDAFVLSHLKKEGLQLSPEASPETLVRRVYLDITGIPPTIAQQNEFLNDKEPGAYDRLVDSLLDSPQYGERMATPWLDCARYADTNGYEKDLRRTIWPYRDWVIKAFNTDMPYNRFIVKQLAGDMLPNATTDDLIATGFQRNTMLNQEGGVDQGEQRWLTLVDRVGTTGSVFLGTTLACCQCHNHKYDPFSQEDFYRMLAFYEHTDEPDINLYDPRYDEMAKQVKTLTDELAKIKSTDPAYASAKTEVDSLTREVNQARQDRTMVMRESASNEVPSAYLRIKGGYLSPGKLLTAGTPAYLEPMKPGTPLDRLGMAEWIASRDNPLTARVEVNRVWSMVWGIGLVKTEGDFGTQGEHPAYQDMLDYLAVRFEDDGWSIKKLLKLIVTSNTYKQSSAETPAMTEKDPENRLLARGARFRMSAEMVRDNALEAADLLSLKMGGPPVFPDQPDGVWNVSYNDDKWVTSPGHDRFRRGLYTFWRRTDPYPAFIAFDSTSRESCTVNRTRTNTPLQALVLLNDPVYELAARGMAKQMLAQKNSSPTARVDLAYRALLCRAPTKDELTRVVAYLQKMQMKMAAAPKDAAEYLGKAGAIDDASVVDSAAYQMTAHVLFNLDEAITKE
jgi:hypothetical protein